MYIQSTNMKTLGQLLPFAAPLTVAFSFLLSSGNLRASGPGVAGNTGSANGTATTGGANTGAVASGGARGGSVAPIGASRSTAAPASTGVRPDVSFSNNAPRLSTGNFARSSVNRASAPAAYAPGVRVASPAANASQPAYRTPARPTNTWSGTAIPSTDSMTGRNQSSGQAYRSYGDTNNRFAGQRLNPSAYGANLLANRSSNNWSRSGRDRFPYRYYNYPYAYGSAYAPYVGSYGGYYGAYPYYADGTNTVVADGVDNGAPTVTPQYTDQGRDASDDQQNPAPQNRVGNPNVQPTAPDNGPDSLVEAVQQELIRRGYFGGKVDAMYGPDTKEALRKFQQDHHLADSGLINEATLHALQLD